MILIETPELAARRIHDERFDVIFVDTGLPNLSRAGFTRIIRNSKLNSQAPLVLLTGLAAPQAGTKDASAGVSAIAKYALPAELPVFLRKLKQKLMADRRKHRRLSFRASLNCVEGVRRFRATSVNLSASGMMIESSFPLEIGTGLELYFYLASEEPLLHARGRVARMEASDRVGVVFQNLGSFERERLRQFLDLHLPPRS